MKAWDERCMASPDWRGAALALARTAKELVAGDEWFDENTEEFVRELVFVMKGDRNVDAPRADGNKVRFDYVQSGFLGSNVKLVLRVMEFGYGGQSESLNGTIYSEKVRNFRIPGGTTRQRDARELWRSAKDVLEDIIARAR